MNSRQTALAWSRWAKVSRFRHSSRRLPLNRSLRPFCHGLPGSIVRAGHALARQRAHQGLGDELRAVVAAAAIGVGQSAISIDAVQALPTATTHSRETRTGAQGFCGGLVAG